MRPTPASRAAASSSVDLLLPCRTRRAGGHAGGEGDVQLAAGGDVEVHALLVGQPGHGPAEEGLGGVGHPVAPGRDRLPTGAAQMVLVVDEEGRAELGGEVEEVDAPDPEVPVLAHFGRVRQEMTLDRCGRDVVIGARAGAARMARWRRRHDGAGYGRSPEAPTQRGLRSSLAFSCAPVVRDPAPVAQRIEHRPPEPVAQVRVLPGALV